MKKYYYAVLLTLLLNGCSSSPTYKTSPEWDKAKLAKLHVYRTDVAFHSLNPEKPFFYIDGMEFGNLGTGQAITIEVLAGKHVLTVKEPILFMPGYENGKIEIETVENKEYFVRYSKNLSDVIITGSTSAVVTGKTTIQLVNKKYYSERK